MKQDIAFLTSFWAVIISVPLSAQVEDRTATSNRIDSAMSTEDLLKLTPEGVIVVPDIAYRKGNED